MLFGYTGQFWIDHDASAIFADNDFLVHFDLKLFLRWNAVEAAATCVTLNVDHTEAVACVLAYSLECRQGALVDAWLDLFRLVAQTFLVLTCF